MATVPMHVTASPPRAISQTSMIAMVLLLAAVITRASRFSDPNLHVDEIFYLQVADLMRHGALPYVDVWDRKPIGLFLLYRAIRLLGGDGIIHYQIVATAFAFGTSFVIAQIARRLGVSASGACLAGIVYLASLLPIGGYGGQSPVFYNLFVAGAAFLTLSALQPPDSRQFMRAGTWAMLLCGMAMQIKYSALFEGCFLGGVLVWHVWKAYGLKASLQAALLFGGCGIAPTVLALCYYAAIGEFAAFWFANFVSITLRPPTDPVMIVVRLYRLGLDLTPLLACLVGAFFIQRRQDLGTGEAVTYEFVLRWAAVAFFGFFIFGTYFNHYALPLLVPLSIAAAPLFDRGPSGAVAGLMVAWGALVSGSPAQSPHVSQMNVAKMTSAVKDNLNGGCLFMFDGPPIVDYQSGACHVTRYIFPYHLSLAIEETGLGVDPVAELRRVLERKPAVIVSAAVPVPLHEPNQKTRRLLYTVLKRDYHLVGSYEVRKRTYQVYASGNAGPTP